MRSAVRQIGGSWGIILPELLLSEIGARVGDPVEVSVEHGRLVIAPLPGGVRVGWAEASRTIAAGCEVPAWPEFANDGDEHLEW